MSLLKALRFTLHFLALIVLFPFAAVAINGGESRIQTFNGWNPIEIISEGDSMPAAGAPDEWHLPGVFDGAGAYLAELDDVGDHQTPIIRIHINH